MSPAFRVCVLGPVDHEVSKPTQQTNPRSMLTAPTRLKSVRSFISGVKIPSDLDDLIWMICNPGVKPVVVDSGVCVTHVWSQYRPLRSLG